MMSLRSFGRRLAASDESFRLALQARPDREASGDERQGEAPADGARSSSSHEGPKTSSHLGRAVAARSSTRSARPNGAEHLAEHSAHDDEDRHHADRGVDIARRNGRAPHERDAQPPARRCRRRSSRARRASSLSITATDARKPASNVTSAAVHGEPRDLRHTPARSGTSPPVTGIRTVGALRRSPSAPRTTATRAADRDADRTRRDEPPRLMPFAERDDVRRGVERCDRDHLFSISINVVIEKRYAHRMPRVKASGRVTRYAHGEHGHAASGRLVTLDVRRSGLSRPVSPRRSE